MSKFDHKNFFQKIKKNNDDVIFSGLDLEITAETGLGFRLEKILRSRS